MPKAPKEPSTRARRNRSSTHRHLSVVHDVKTPPLPVKKPAWLKATRDWWKDIWSSPMAPEFDRSDLHGLYVLAALVDEFWRNPSTALAAEIRLQRQCFGLSPIDRRRLQWEIDREAEERTGRRRRERVSSADGDGEEMPDPRALLG